MPSSTDRSPAFMGCLVTPRGHPVRSPHDVVIDGPDRKGLYRAKTDGAGKFVVPVIEALEEKQVLTLRVIDSRTHTSVTTHTMLFQPGGRLQFETIPLPVTEKKDDPPTPVGSGRVNKVTRQWRAAIRKRLRSAGQQDILVPRSVRDAILDLNNADHMAHRLLSGDLHSATPFVKLLGQRQNPGSSRAFFAGLNPAASGFATNRDLPCVFDDGGALDVAFAGLLLDVHRAEVLGDLTQPGAYAEQAAAFLHDRHQSLQGFAGAVVDLSEGRISEAAFRKRVFDGGDEAVPMPREEPGHPDGPTPSGTGPQPLRLAPSQPSLSFDRGRDVPCDLMWVDCVDEIVQTASSYVLPSRCSDEDTIGSLTPAAVCRGAEDVEIEIRPVAGRSFAGDGVHCKALLQRLSGDLGVSAHRTSLSVISYTSDLVKVRLAKAERSGCVGFRGTGGGVQGNVGFVRSCLKSGRIHNAALDRILTPDSGGLRLIHCTGRNQLSVLSEPVLDALTLDGVNDSASLINGTGISLIEEACTDVTIRWRFEFDDPNVAPADYIRVSLLRGSSVVASGLGAEDSFTVDDQDDQAYTLKAVASTGQDSCGELDITVQIDRYEALHLRGAGQVQTGQPLTLSVRASCPAPAGGIAVQLGSSDGALLEVPAGVSIAEGQTSVDFEALGKGSSCAAVEVTATAENHLSDSRSVEVYTAPRLSSLSPLQAPTCQTTTLTISGSCFKAGETSVRAIKDGVLETLEIVSITAGQIVVEVSGLSTGAWRIEVVSRGLISNTLTFTVTAAPAVIEDFQALVVDPPSGDNTTVVPCVTNWTAVSWRLRNCSRVEVRLNGELIHEQVLAGCGGPYEDLFTRPVEGQAVYRLSAFPVGGGNPENREITLGTGGIKKLTLVNDSDDDLVVWVYDGQIVFADEIPTDSPKHDLASGASLDLTFGNCDFKDISCVDKAAAIAEDEDPYGNAVTINHLVVFNVWDIIGATNGEEETVQIN